MRKNKDSALNKEYTKFEYLLPFIQQIKDFNGFSTNLEWDTPYGEILSKEQCSQILLKIFYKFDYKYYLTLPDSFVLYKDNLLNYLDLINLIIDKIKEYGIENDEFKIFKHLDYDAFLLDETQESKTLNERLFRKEFFNLFDMNNVDSTLENCIKSAYIYNKEINEFFNTNAIY